MQSQLDSNPPELSLSPSSPKRSAGEAHPSSPRLGQDWPLPQCDSDLAETPVCGGWSWLLTFYNKFSGLYNGKDRDVSTKEPCREQFRPQLGREAASFLQITRHWHRCFSSGVPWVPAASATPIGGRTPIWDARLFGWCCFSDVTPVGFPISLFSASFPPSWEQLICLWLLLVGNRVQISCLINPRLPVPGR